MEKVLMFRPWSRTDTQDWIHQIESRIEDIDYYLKRTVEWCENNGVFEDHKVIMCCLVTCIWVSSMRNENISFKEITDILQLHQFEDSNLDKIYNVCAEFQNLDHETILEMLISKSSDWGSHFPS